MKPDHPPRASRAASRAADNKVRKVTVADEVGQRIDNFLLRTLSDVPKSRIYRMLRKGEVRVNGGRIKPTYRLEAGDEVRIPPYWRSRQTRETFIGSEQLSRVEAAIIFEDDDLLVLDKPAGIAVHGGSGVSFGVIEALRRLRPHDRLELAHRLDRDTSGCLLVSKHRRALSRVHASIRAGTMGKRYALIVHGLWPDFRTSVHLPLQKYVTHSGERRVRVDPAGKESLTEFSVEARSACASLLTAQLITGRTHQIRVHSAASGHSIVGDTKYAPAADVALCKRFAIERLCLHAEEVVLPWDQGERRFTCPRPAEFARIWSQLS